MKIASFDIFEYRLPLKKPLRIKNHSIKIRRGFVVRLADENKNLGFGEIAPLPGLSREDLPLARNQLLKLRRHLRGALIPESVAKLSGQWLGNFKLTPSVQLGLDIAVLNLLARSRRILLCKLIASSAPDTIALSGLLQGSKAQVCREARTLLAHRFKSLKLKIGNDSIENDIEKVRALRKIVRNRAKLRLDANKAWDLKTAVLFGKAVGPRAIDYIEEPLRDTPKLSEFYRKTKIPIALDESLRSLTPRQLKKFKGLKAIVLKPSIIGGLDKTFAWAIAAKKLKIKTIISSSFESGIGLIALANLAASIGNAPVGLDTLKWFKFDLLKSNIALKRGFLHLNKVQVQESNIRQKILKRINNE